MTLDPRPILKAAGVECPELDEWEAASDRQGMDLITMGGYHFRLIRALAKLVAKYKWERGQMAEREFERAFAEAEKHGASDPGYVARLRVDAICDDITAATPNI